ncbi:MAG: aspartate aminotransferase family protein [Cytophagaceae bacterium]|nr:aspartate aminotransferase family protein [Cytophagaceae bacterium]
MHQRQLFLQHMAQTSPAPMALEVERAEGVWLYDRQGKRYLDLIAGIGVSNVGHRHPKVLAAIQHQLDRYLHVMVYGEYVLSPQVALAKAIAETLPGGLHQVYLVNSGSEATEGAMKLAKRFTGRTELISCAQAYHGSTQGSLSLMGDEYFKQAYRPLLPNTQLIRYNDHASLDFISSQTAAVFVETIQGEAGLRVASKEWMKALRKRCTDCGTLLVLDEIQAGFGRTGTFWAFEAYEIMPDIVLMAKGMGGGMPIGAFAASVSIMQCLSYEPVLGHITTFGGHPVSAAAALATLHLIKEQQLNLQALRIEQQFHNGLKHPKVIELRSAGAMMALELGSWDLVQACIQLALEKGLITDWFLFCNTALRIAPPLTMTEEEANWAIQTLLECLEQLPS